jgi:hypothetical protein
VSFLKNLSRTKHWLIPIKWPADRHPNRRKRQREYADERRHVSDTSPPHGSVPQNEWLLIPCYRYLGWAGLLRKVVEHPKLDFDFHVAAKGTNPLFAYRRFRRTTFFAVGATH